MDSQATHRRNLLISTAGCVSQLAGAAHWREVATPALASVCVAARADRALLLRFDGDGEAAISRRILGWTQPGVPGASPEAYTRLSLFPFVGDGHNFMHHLAAYQSGAAVTFQFGPSLSESDRWLMGLAKVHSCLRIPVFVEQRLWGAIGFDSLTRHRLWLDPEIVVLGALARVVGAMIERDGD